MKTYGRPTLRKEIEKSEENTMKVSVISAVLDSHEIVRRHILHYNKMNLPGDVEVIFIDDGSQIPLSETTDRIDKNFNFTLLETHNKAKWTQPAARNMGAKHARGEFCIFTDIDHIVTKNLIDYAKNPETDVVRFVRCAAVIDEDGNFTQDPDTLKAWGLKDKYIKRPTCKISSHGNSYIMRTGLYIGLGGVDERFVGTGRYPNREEALLKRQLRRLEYDGRIRIIDKKGRPTIYMFPNGNFCGGKDYNPFGFFHKTSRYSNKEKRRMRQAK